MVVLLSVLHIIIIAALSFLFWRRDRDIFFWPALTFKLLAGLSLGLLYQYYYQAGDTWTFFYDAEKVANAIIEQPKNIFSFFWNDNFANGVMLENNRPRSLFLIKWATVFNLLSGNNYWITSLYFSFISFLASWMLYRKLSTQFPDYKNESALSFLFIPSIVFWGSGLIKESLAIAALFGITACFISWYFNRSFKIFALLFGLLSLWVLWSLKYYWLAIWLAVVAPLVVVQLLKGKVDWVNRNPKWSWGILLSLSLAFVSMIHPNFYYNRLLLVIIENNEAYMNLSDPNDVIHFHNLEPTFFSMLINSPWGFLSGVFRPFIFEAGNILQIAASIENLVLLTLFVLMLIRIPELLRQTTEFHLALGAYAILLSIFLSLSTPNFGSLSRFKIGFTSFLWFGLLSASAILKKIRFKK